MRRPWARRKLVVVKLAAGILRRLRDVRASWRWLVWLELGLRLADSAERIEYARRR